MYWWVTGGMTVTLLLFARGWQMRGEEVSHRRWMTAGVMVNLLSALLLVGSIYGYYEGDAVRAGFLSCFHPAFSIAHRLLAGMAALLMLAQGLTGYLRAGSIHRTLQRFFIPLYLIVYFSGLVLFYPGQVC
ncbi:MAG: hypothetical protein HS115_07235 [Spirochaetales bacterium]|nr:hypothetical protein [Spirochaetales bacterium]